jgi:NitT/TauT family transport system substrate-binding protein
LEVLHVKRLVLTLPMAGMLLVTGCSGTEQSGAEDGSGGGELTPVTVGLIPTVDVAPTHLGIANGFYEDCGVDLAVEMAQGGAALLPAVISGQYDVGFSEVASLIVARDKGLPVEIVMAGSASNGTPGDDYGAIMVAGDSAIGSMADLPGKTVAINSISNINYVLIMDAVTQAGGDPSAVDFVEISFPDMVGALAEGRVDAIFEPEPFKTIAERQGMRQLHSLYAEASPDQTVATYFTTPDFANSEPEAAQCFIDATKKGQQYATDHPDETREIVSTYTNIDPDVISELTLPAFPTEVDRDSIERVAELSQEYGLTEELVNVDELLSSN